MATFTAWVFRIGNAGAARNAAVACERRRAIEARVTATCAELAQRYDRVLPPAPARNAIARRTAA